jgi:hypothetical protein
VRPEDDGKFVALDVQTRDYEVEAARSFSPTTKKNHSWA